MPTINLSSTDRGIFNSIASALGGGHFGEGNIAAGNNYVDVTHGCGATPTIILITPEDGFDSPYEVPRANIGATTFRVRYKGGVTQTEGVTGYFLWEAK